MDPLNYVLHIVVVVPLYILLTKLLLPDREMKSHATAEAENISKAKAAYISDQDLPRYVGKWSTGLPLFVKDLTNSGPSLPEYKSF